MRIAFRLLSILGIVFAARSAAQSGPMHLVYGVEVRASDLGKFHFRVEVTNPETGPGGGDLTLVMPYWAPGAYRPMTTAVRGGAAAGAGFTGFDAEDETGSARKVTPDGDRRWKVDARGARRITFKYTNSTPGSRANNRSFLDADSGLIDGPRSWVYVDGMKHLPAHIRFSLPEGWQVGTGLDPTFDPMVFHADDYDRLADCPTAVGFFHTWTFQVRGVPHRVLALTGKREPRFNAEAFTEMCRKCVETFVTMFDDVPYQHYTFIYTSGGGGGLEHLTSTTISVGPAQSLSAAAAAGVTYHEFFHAWNVKRLRPRKLGPFDYTGPVRVKDLWICEGITSYYTTLGMWRSGVSSDERFLASYGSSIAAFQRNPAHVIVSPEEASWTVWDRDKPFSMDYYNQGEVLGLMIDLAIRDGSANRKGFDDVMRKLYRTYGGYYRHQPPLPGFESEDVLRVLVEETGVDLADFWNRHIRAAEEVDWNRYLAAAGWEIETKDRILPALASGRRGERGEGGMVVKAEEGDAFHRAGFRDGDVVKSVNGTEVRNARSFAAAFAGLEVGKPFKAAVTRAGQDAEVAGTVEAATELSAIAFADGDGGVVVTAVPGGTGPARAGLLREDVVTGVDGAPPGSAEELRRKLARAPAGAKTTLMIRRGPEVKTIGIEAAPRRIVDVGAVRPVADPTPRQLAIRQGLKSGTTPGVPAAAGGG